MFRVIFVMDLFNRSVVHAKGGNRKTYLPISESSKICSNSDPVEIVRSLKPSEVYIADLNVLEAAGKEAEGKKMDEKERSSISDLNADLIRKVSDMSSTLLDFGVSGVKDLKKALSLAKSVVIGTETGTLAGIRKAAFMYPEKLCVSLDLKHGKLLKRDPNIPEDLFEVIALLNELPLKALIFLDLDRVGTSTGFDPVFLKKLAQASKPALFLGGGVRSQEDLFTLEKIGLQGALVATAIHNGAIPLSLLRKGQKKV